MKEFLEFLGAQSPYDRLDDDDLNRLAKAVEVEYFTAGTVIVEADAAPLDCLYVVRVGAVEIIDRGRITDVLGAGETFGHISVLSGLPPPLQVRAVEDTLCYRLPDPRTLLAHPRPTAVRPLRRPGRPGAADQLRWVVRPAGAAHRRGRPSDHVVRRRRLDPHRRRTR